MRKDTEEQQELLVIKVPMVNKETLAQLVHAVLK